MLVEFFGIPGAGKSTISHRVSKELREDGRIVSEPMYTLTHEATSAKRYLYKSAYAAYGTALRPTEALATGQLIADTEQPSRLTLGKTIFNWLFVNGVIRSRETGQLQLLDQGLCQAAWSVALSAERNRIEELCEMAVAALARAEETLIIIVEITPETARERLSTRADDGSRVTPNGSGHTVREAFELNEQLEASLVSATDSCPSIEILRVENESRLDLDDGVTKICDRLRQQYDL